MTKVKTMKRRKPTVPDEPVNRPTQVRDWWLVDIQETRTLKVRATGPKQARDIAARVMADCYPQTALLGEPDIVRSVAHRVICGEGRPTTDRRVSR